ncbi:hypothetical protein DL1_07020 [Thioclava dalianensis]|uniref:DUF218 domain-containing protein n=1 Tax=Thioclava dalianensis TaxID=1185766 RepID=A0A074TI80_9RHOB|nr:YdcF family protein [Thioclava dalianensis]KEP71339.1 hypothetical protein DL1_07020 [Thioclava dalianensis]SFM77701.1 DUF218 domain-containing protein [Thioclava dalianensis]
MTCAFILGAAVWPGGRPSPTLERRSLHAAQMYHAGRVSRIMCCGGLGRNAPSEADVMVEILTGAGVPRTAILIEDRSTTTRENIAFGLERLGMSDEIVLVTDGYHAPRARAIARSLGIRCTSDSPAHKARPRTILRESGAWLKFLWQRMRGI